MTDIRPVFMFYPGLYPLLMLNYWARRSKIPITAIILSDFDLKHQGKCLNFFELIWGVSQYSGWAYTGYLLFVAKFSVPIVSCWNLIRKLLGKPIKIKTFEQIAKEQGTPIFRSKDFNSPACQSFIKNVNANLIVSAYNNQILRSVTYRLPKLGAINVHHSLLPNFRGLDGPFQAIYHDVTQNGATVHRVDSKIDTGNIILQQRIRIHRGESVFSLSVRCWMHGAVLLEKVLAQFQNGTVTETKQKASDVQYPYESFPKKSQVREFLKAGKKLLEWQDLVRTFKD